jgi:hypothetical protein
MRFICKLGMEWAHCCGMLVDINRGEMWNGCVDGKTGDGSWILWVWNGVFTNLVTREGSCLFEYMAATVAHTSVIGISVFFANWWCVDINEREKWDSCTEGRMRDCSWLLWLWNGGFANWVIKVGSCLFEWTAATVACDNIMNKCGIS